jgi:uncharacterized protein YecA (UPF0149 family)
MATHHQARQIEYIAKDIDQMAAHLKRDVQRLENFAELLRTSVEDNGEELTTQDKYNIRQNALRAVFEPMRSAGYAVSVETFIYTIDRLIDGEG